MSLRAFEVWYLQADTYLYIQRAVSTYLKYHELGSLSGGHGPVHR